MKRTTMASLALMVCCFAGCSNGEDPPIAGTWSGDNIQFNVASDGDKITRNGSALPHGASMYVRFTSFPSCIVSLEMFMLEEAEISSNAFSYNGPFTMVNGNFNTTSSAEGTASYSEFDPFCGAVMTSSMSWNATSGNRAANFVATDSPGRRVAHYDPRSGRLLRVTTYR